MRYLFLTCLVVFILAEPVASFGAGNIPNYAYLNDKAYRHGDIEEILTSLVKSLNIGADTGGFMGLMTYVFSMVTGGPKFSKMDMQRIYFGNWLRDYSQAMDIAGLSKFTAHTMITIISVLGFMEFGFATAEFEVNLERLGVYLPVEHIDNPKGYGVTEGDARQVHPNLRPPVDPQELEINHKNGMKNYIATEGEVWDTSTAHVRRLLQKCIELGRKSHGKENEEHWEALRLLGSALHTLEDLLAHSNWCELALRKLGHAEVFCHVGDAVVIETPSGPAPPLVTGTFGSADFMHSVLGEGMDRLSETSMTNLVGKIEEAKNKGDSHISIVKTLISKLLSAEDTHAEKMNEAEHLKNKAFDFNPAELASEEIQRMMWHILEWRDAVYKDILNKIAMIPGLSALFEEFTEALNAFIFTILDPILKPILQEVTDALQEGSKAIINSDDQYEVFDDPHASDPSHSILAKDHFNLILNEPAGKVAKVVVEHSVNLIVQAWCDEHEDQNKIIDNILETFHHPYFSSPNSNIQRKMMGRLKQWFDSHDPKQKQKILEALTKKGVREGRNKRFEPEKEKETAEVQIDDPQTGEATLVPQVPPKENPVDRNIRYEIKPGRPIFERFDVYREPEDSDSDGDEEDEYRSVKSDEEFWKDPYAYSSSRRQLAQRPRARGPHANNGFPSQKWGHPPTYVENHFSYASSSLLEEAQSGYHAGLAQVGSKLTQSKKRHKQYRYHRYPDF